TLLTNGVTQNSLYTKIYYDKNNNGVIDSGDEINSEVVSANENQQINTTLGAGTYYVG
ncbi:MAG TPA: VCBS repeat-containing protein, partial [Cyanobacteria bacterium UBA12227]|nr:VCBS repeat-containing protein [Cyanobacteria bacterium UBA12227]